MKKIVAVALGPVRSGNVDKYQINSRQDLKDNATRKVRRYLHGLVDGLTRLGYQFGSDPQNDKHFQINFHLSNPTGLKSANTFKFREDAGFPAIIVGMSTRVVKEAAPHIAATNTRIVGVVSEPALETVNQDPYCEFSARRTQTAGDCFNKFRLAVPQLQNIIVLHNPDYNASTRALESVDTAAEAANFPYNALPISNPSAIVSTLRNDTNLPWRDTDSPAVPNGLLVLPVDMFLGNAHKIIKIAHGKGIPTFFPVTDFVKHKNSPALGGYGVPQRRCGEAMAGQADPILSTGNMPTERWVLARDYDFEFLVSTDAADDLGITLNPDVLDPEE